MHEKKTALDNLNKELESINAQAAPLVRAKEAKPAKAKKKASTKPNVVLAYSRRKTARSRVRLTKGNGKITVNKKNISTLNPVELRDLMLEPVNFSEFTKQISKNSNISVNVYGGGISSQANAIRSVIAKALVEASQSEELKREFLKYDRTLLVDDIRQVEPKKFLGPKARSRFQTSYR